MTDDNEGNNDGISGRESVDYSYNDYYYSPSPLRRLGQTDDYYYYYADEYYPYIEARNERQHTGKLSKTQNFHFFIHWESKYQWLITTYFSWITWKKR